MTYIMGILAVSALVFLSHRLSFMKSAIDSIGSLSFFKLHFLAFGMLTVLFMPSSFQTLLDQCREPVMMFCLSWIGLYYGCGLELRVHQKFSPWVILFNVLEPVIVFLFVCLVVALYLFFTYDGWEFTSVAVIIAIFSAFTVFRRSGIFHRDDDSEDHPVLEELLPIGNIFPVTALCIAGIALFGPTAVTIGDYTFSGIFTLVSLNILWGLATGMILNMLISNCDSLDAQAIVMVGVIALGSGIAYVFSLSPIFVGTISGAFLINATLKRLQILETLNSTNEIINCVYMFVLGTMLTPVVKILKYDLTIIFASALAIFAFRASLKFILSSIWTARSKHKSEISGMIWIGITGQGILASAAAFESALYVSLLPSMFFLIMSLLILNQLSLQIFVWFKEYRTKA